MRLFAAGFWPAEEEPPAGKAADWPGARDEEAADTAGGDHSKKSALVISPAGGSKSMAVMSSSSPWGAAARNVETKIPACARLYPAVGMGRLRQHCQQLGHAIRCRSGCGVEFVDQVGAKLPRVLFSRHSFALLRRSRFI